MLSFFERIFSPRSKPPSKEAAFVVEVTGHSITVHRPDGSIESVARADLQSVFIETNDTGPWGTDFWWCLLGSGEKSGCVFPCGATGEQDAIEALQQLPGFDNEAFTQAIRSTDNQRFQCWSAGPNPSFNPDAFGAG